MTSTATRAEYHYCVEPMGGPPRRIVAGDPVTWPESFAPCGALARMASPALIHRWLPIAARRRVTDDARRITHYRVYRASAPTRAPFSQIFRSRR